MTQKDLRLCVHPVTRSLPFRERFRWWTDQNATPQLAWRHIRC